ncbi:MAG: dihydrofolate reductase family protein [Candidatus Kapabacteria bacterium]|nr:dihydrofolate reductase family protein [Candidatus Kapabacteria bacterium]
MDTERKVILYIAASVDGFIAKPNDDLSFLSIVQKDGEDYGYSEFINSVDTVIIGRKTYDWVMDNASEFIHTEIETYVITRTLRPDNGKTKFYNGDLKELVLRLKSQPGSNIFVDGGAEIVNELLRQNLIDEFIISVIPILVGSGTRLFKNGLNEQKLEFVESKLFDTGLVQTHYKLASNTSIGKI